MQKLQDSVFSIIKTTNLSPAVFSFLQPSDEFTDKTPLGGILKDTKHGWLALGPKFCVVNLKTGLKVAARTFGTPISNSNTFVTSVVELPKSLTPNSIQLIVSLQNDESGMICVLHVNGSQLLRCIQTEVVVTELAVCDRVPDGPLSCFDGVVMAGTKCGEIFAFDLNRSSLIQALKDISQGYEHLVQNESNPANLSFLQYKTLNRIGNQRELALENDNHIAFLLNENSIIDGQYIFRNPDGTVRMKSKRDHIRVTVLQYIPQLGSLAVGYNFGAFQIWNIMTLELEFTSHVNVECLPVTHFGFQEPCDDPRAFCYLWVVFSITDRFEEEEFPLGVMYSLTYQGKRMLSDTKCLYQEFSSATIRFQLELGTGDDSGYLGGKCVSCHTYSVNSTLAAEGEESMLNICQIVWECWGENPNSPSQYGMLLFDLDQWYKDQMPATWRLESSAFMSVTWCGAGWGGAGGGCVTLDVRLAPASLALYSHATRLEEHFYPNSLQYNCICLNTSEACVLSTVGIQRQIISSIDEAGPTALLSPARLYGACVAAGLTPLYLDTYTRHVSAEEQRCFLLSVSLEARLSRFLKRCAHDWATGSHSGAGCTLPFLVDWCWKRAIDLKENAKELTAPLFASSALPDRNVVRCLEHCVQQLTQLTGLLDAVLTKCCNLIVPDALSEIEEKYKGIGTVSLYFQVVQWFLRVGLLPERHDSYNALPYPAQQLNTIYSKRRLKLNRLQDNAPANEEDGTKPCSLLYIDQLIEQEFGGDRVRELWMKGGSECKGLYPPPSLYSLLRLYLLCDIAEEHKHSLVLYLLVDYSMVYDELRYESVIRRLMQFPTMFGLSNTAIKATQAFWHLDHRDFDFALDQLQCLTGNTLSTWQHNVVLSALLAQQKSQAALQYLHVRKPAPLHTHRGRGNDTSLNTGRLHDHDKLEDWQPCCNLYLARGLVFEALDVIRICVQNSPTLDEKTEVLNFLYKGCRNTGNLAKLLQVTLLPLEEEVFINYLKDCNDPNTSDILVMYYLQNSRYLEAESYNNKLKHKKPRGKEVSTSYESLFDMMDRENARDAIVEVVCSSLPAITTTVANHARDMKDVEHVIVPKPMSVYVQAKSPKNTFTYKSSFIQDTIENASETWINKPKMRRGIKRALNIEETPFICTPKLNRTRSILSTSQEVISDSTPAKRSRLSPSVRPRARVTSPPSSSLAALLDMPHVHQRHHTYDERRDTGTPHSILKTRRGEGIEREAPSPVDSRYLNDSEDELLETSSNHTHYSDSTNKHLRFTIPTPIDFEPSPTGVEVREQEIASEPSTGREKEMDISTDGFVTTASHPMTETHPLESPPKKLATDDTVNIRKSLKDTVRARRSLSVSMNSSLSDDPNTSVESIADLPVTLLNPKYSGEKRHPRASESNDTTTTSVRETDIVMPGTPKSRPSIRSDSEGRSVGGRSRSSTPELSPRASSLASIPEQPKQEVESEPHARQTLLTAPRQLRSRSRTPERKDKLVADSPKLEVISESPTKSISPESATSSPKRRGLRSRSRTPEVEIVEQPLTPSPRALRSRSKTPEKIISSRLEHSARGKKSLSRLVLEANTFSKTKQDDKMDSEADKNEKSTIECTPMKTIKQVTSLMDVTLSPIVNKSILASSADTTLSENIEKDTKDKSSADSELKPLPAFNVLQETRIEKSVLHSYQSSIEETSVTSTSIREEKILVQESSALKPLPAFTLNETQFNKSILHSYESSIAEESSEHEDSMKPEENISKPYASFANMTHTDFGTSVLKSAQSSLAEYSADSKVPDCSSLMTDDSDFDMKDTLKKLDHAAAIIQKERETIGEIVREINEIEGDMSDEDNESSGDEEMVEDEEMVQAEESGEEVDEDDEEVDEDDEEADIDVDEADEDVEDESLEEESEEEASSPSDGEDNDDVISIKDSDESNSDSVRLEIDEQSSESNKLPDLIPESETQKEVPIAISEPTEIIVESKITEQTPEEMIVQSGKVEMIVESEKIDDQSNPDSTVDPLNQANISLLTDDNSGVDLDKSDVKLTYSDVGDKTTEGDGEQAETNEKESESAEIKTTVLPVDVNMQETVSTDNNDKLADLVPTTSKDTKTKKSDDVTDAVTVEHKTSEPALPKHTEILETKQTTEQPIEPKAPGTKETIAEKDVTMEEKPISQPESQETTNTEKQTTQTEKPSRSRKRAKSTSSNKSVEPDIETEIKTPITRKRTQSNASAKSVEQKTPETDKTAETNTPRRRAKTPTSAEVRKIITRRVSREMSEDSKLLDDSKEELLTPKRRATRSRSKNIDDNESVASESSIVSGKSKISEDGDRVGRKGKKSVLTSKPELSVIPEVTAEDTKLDSSEIIKEYSSSRRLTRHQKAVLESWMETPASPRRRASTTSRTSQALSEEEEEEAEQSPAFDVQPMDRISLLNKTDFEARVSRAASESKSTPKAAKINRRISVDIAADSPGSPRGRRASFTRACEALHTPKGRRVSTDLRPGEAESPVASDSTEVVTQPARRTRRVGSTTSNSSVTKSETGKRSKKTPIDESNDVKKK